MDILPHEKQIQEYEKTIARLKEHSENDAEWCRKEVKKLEIKLAKIKKNIYSSLSSWERISICRHPERPHSIDYIGNLFTSFQELHGDRLFSDDRSIIGGLGKIDDQKFMVIGQEKGRSTEDRINRNFGMCHPEGFRKALRLMKIAEKFNIPIISFIDTAGAYPGLTAEERGQGWAIANNLKEMSTIKTPIIVIIIGEGCSGGALGMAIGDRIAMLEHSYYSVISPEGCASILWHDAAKKNEAAQALKLNSENLLEFDIVDEIIKEPLGGAHHDHEATYREVKECILRSAADLKKNNTEKLIEKRYRKFRNMGIFYS
jgi:acetyl-CoA carboxylase carboxyl transferase subunit alpha